MTRLRPVIGVVTSGVASNQVGHRVWPVNGQATEPNPSRLLQGADSQAPLSK